MIKYNEWHYEILKAISSKPKEFAPINNLQHWLNEEKLIFLKQVNYGSLYCYENHLTFKGKWVLHQLSEKYGI